MKRMIILAVWMAGTVASASLFTFDDANKINLKREHIFMVDKDGKCLDPADKPSGWLFAKIHGTNVNDSLDWIQAGISNWCAKTETLKLADSGLPPRVVVFIHGGMNKYDDTYNRIEDRNLMQSLKASNCYPVFVAWNSGFGSAYWQHLWSIRQGEEVDTWQQLKSGPLTSPIVLVSDLASGIARVPKTLAGQLVSDFATTETPTNWVTYKRRIPFSKRTARWEGFELLIHSNTVQRGYSDLYHPPQPEDKKRGWGERAVRFTEYAVTTPTKIVTLPIIDGLGTEAWEMMQRRTRTMFASPHGYDIMDNLGKWHTETPTNFLAVSNWLNRADGDGGMRFLADRLEKWTTNSFVIFSSSNLSFEFYGHSMGTIVLNEMFRYKHGIRTSNIVYLGAACSIVDFEAAMFPYLRANTNTQFYSVSLHRVRERDENGLSNFFKFPILRDLIVRGSLLNWVDGIFARPNTIPDRTLGAWENVTRALPDIPDDVEKQMHFRGCDIESLPVLSRLDGKYEPQVHGDFTKAVFWSKDFYWPNGTNQILLLKKKTLE